MRITRGVVGNAALLTICVLVLVGFVVLVAWGLGQTLTAVVGGLAEDGAAGAG